MSFFKYVCIAFLCSPFLLWNAPAMGAESEWQNPSQVQLSPQGARISVESQVPVTLVNGQPQIEFFIPSDAQNIEIQPTDNALVQWSSTLESTAPLKGDSAVRRTALLQEKARIQGNIEALQARKALWATPPSAGLPQEQMTARQSALDTILPAAQQEIERQQAALQDVDVLLAALPVTGQQSQKIVAVLDGKAASPTANLRYAYTLTNCGWQPDYRFNALPDQGKIDVQLFAKIWQFSGMNWNNADIILVSQNSWQREPAALRPWNISTGDDPAPRPMSANARAVPMSLAAPMAEGDAAPRKMQAPRMQDSAAFTSWELGKRNLPEGTVQVRLSQDIWTTPLQWLARPSLSSSVWLMAQQTLTNTRAWPVGEAAFCIDGLTVGNGAFTPKGDTVTLYFGIDPRVTVQSESDPRLSGKEGLVDKRKTWDWTWEYTVHNSRPKPVDVRIEEPAPQAGDKAMIISYSSKPAPQQGPEHSLYWNITVPAESKTSMSHTVTLSAPQGMKVRPGR